MSIMEKLNKKWNFVLAVLQLFVFVQIFFISYWIRELQTRKFDLHINSGKSMATITCNQTHKLYDLCIINGPTLMDPATSTFFSLANSNPTPQLVVKIRPYPRKTDKTAMSGVKEITLTASSPQTPCGVTHNSTALIFSTGGYTINMFHQFNDGFVPLFITVRSLFLDQDIVLVIPDFKNWWAEKYRELIPHFSRWPIIDMDKEKITHCFRSAIVGLISHGPFNLDPTLLPNTTLLHFHTFLHIVYRQKAELAINQPKSNLRPKLVLVNRKGKDVGREFLNLDEIKTSAEEIGFEVLVFEPTRNTSMVEAFSRIHCSHAIMGIHGAGLTHFLFLRRGAVVMQVMPIGTEKVAGLFGGPARRLGMEYMEYKIGGNESSLRERYGEDEMVMRNPEGYTNGEWSKMRVYMKEQNVRIDLNRFKGFLELGYGKAKRFMEKQTLLVN